MKQIELDEDIYCHGFRIFLQSESASLQNQVVLKALFAFIFQFLIVGLMMFQYLSDESGERIDPTNLLEGVDIGTPTRNLARIVTCFLLHLELLPELQSAKSMLDFARKNPASFKGQHFEFPMLFAVFKLLGGILCLLTNVVILLRSGSIEDVVKDYVAVAIISTIDNMIGGTFKPPGVKLDLLVYMSLDRDNLSDIELFDEYILDKKPKSKSNKQEKKDKKSEV